MQVAVFDLDGVVVDSASLIEQAYIDVGAPAPPPRFMEITWQEWLVPVVGRDRAEFLHSMKNDRYVELIAEASLLGGYHAAHTMRSHGYVTGMLTAAPWATLPALRRAFRAWPFDFAAAGYRITMKLHVMKQLGPGGVYVDDVDYRKDVEEVGWHFVLYEGQTGHDLWREMDEKTWIST